MMRYVYFANNRLGVDVLRWLVDQGHPPAGLVVHPPERARFTDELVGLAALPSGDVKQATELSTEDGRRWLIGTRADWFISVLFGYIIPARTLEIPAKGAINLHPSLLPFNRGADPNVWSIVEGTPAGVSLHWIDAGVDTGELIAQQEVAVDATDTGLSLYRKLEEAALDLFRRTWPCVVSGEVPRLPQPPGGTVHRVKDARALDRIDPDAMVRAGSLIDLLRARTFPPYRNAFIEVGGRRIYVRVELEKE